MKINKNRKVKKEPSGILKLILDSGLTGILSLLFSFYGVYLIIESRCSDIEVRVRLVQKAPITIQESNLNKNKYLLYILYLEVTNTGKIPIDFNYIEGSAFQDDKYIELDQIVPIKDFIRTKLIYITSTRQELCNKLFLNKTELKPNETNSGYVIFSTTETKYNMEFTNKFKFTFYDKLSKSYEKECSRLDAFNLIDPQEIERRTGVVFNTEGLNLTPDNKLNFLK